MARLSQAPDVRAATDEDLAEHYVRHDGCEKCRGQILREMECRDVHQARREAAAASAKARRFSRRIERQEAIETAWQAAERDTRGHMLNAKSRARGIDDRSLFEGSEERAYRYASDELKAHWERNPRPTRAQLSSDPAAFRRERSLSNVGRAQPSRRRPAVRSATVTTGRGPGPAHAARVRHPEWSAVTPRAAPYLSLGGQLAYREVSAILPACPLTATGRGVTGGEAVACSGRLGWDQATATSTPEHP